MRKNKFLYPKTRNTRLKLYSEDIITDDPDEAAESAMELLQSSKKKMYHNKKYRNIE